MGLNETIWPGILAALVGFATLYFLAAHAARHGAAWPRLVSVGYVSAVILLGICWAAGVHSWLIEPRTLVVRHVEVASEHWSGPPLTIGVIADTHVPGPHSDPARVRSVVDAMNRLNPDVVVLLGDYVGEGSLRIDRSDEVYAAMREGIAAFSELKAPFGVFAVLGNRDRTFDRTSIADALDRADVVLLAGRSVRVSRLGGDFAIVGLANEDDAETDVDAALAAVPSGDRIVISHSPEPFAALPMDVALMLAGHAHCGQVSVPFFGRPITHLRENSAYACHRVDAGGHTLYTSAGVGTSGLPVRFLNPPEIVLITIRRAN
ncbi:MAG: metallophosphoesterase [Alphaproteobacteria bacterium]|nr:metallophosphoesterase [Alphaproteobacteria bacterium]